MKRWMRSVVALGLGLVTALTTSCGGGSGGGSGLRLKSAVQNITVDPTGATLDLTFSQAVESTTAETAGNYTASGGQRATTATVQGDGMTVRVVFDDPVIAGSNTLTVTGIRSAVGNGLLSRTGLRVTSSDKTRPTATTLLAEAISMAANDRIVVTFDKNMVEADVLDLAHYRIENPTGNVLDVRSSQVTWNPGTFELEIVLTNLGGDADNLQTGQAVSVRLAEGLRDVSGNRLEETTLAGTVTGDTERPAILSATQNLTMDSQGRIVDVVFSEDVDVRTGSTPAYYAASGGQQVTLASVSGTLVRVQFHATVVPGTTTLDVHGVRDLAGNDMFAVSGVAITGTDTTPPRLTGATATTVANGHNDTFQLTFDEQVLRADAEDVGRYVVQSPSGTTHDPSSMSASYDPNTRTATITLDGAGPQAVDLHTGDDFVVEVFSVRDVAGNALVYAMATGTVTGDTQAPTLKSITQDTNIEPDGTVLAIEFEEDVASGPAFTPGNFKVSDASTAILSLVHPLNPKVVLVLFDGVVLPGVHTLDVANQADLAGNVAATFSGVAVESMEKDPPALYAALARAVPGSRNDWILLTFDEPMYGPDVEDLTHYTFQNPSGTSLSLGNSTARWEPTLRSVRITLDQAGALEDDLIAGQPLLVTVRDVHDVAGNAVTGTSQVSTTVVGDAQGPNLVIAWQNLAADGSGATTDVVFDEALDTNRAQTLSNWSLMGAVGVATAATAVGNGDVVRITWSVPIVPGSDELAFQNLTDKAGNPALPRTGVPIAADDATPPGTTGSTATTVEGFAGDGFRVTFDEDMHPGDVTNPANYVIDDGGTTVPANVLSGATYAYDAGTRTVDVTFGPANPYDFTNGQGIAIDLLLMRDARGNVQGMLSENAMPGGDATPPAVLSARQDGAALDSVYVQFQDVVDPASVDAGDFVHATWNVLGVQVVESRTVLVQFDGNPAPGVDTLDVSGIADLAGNPMPGTATVAILGNDTQAPSVSVSAEAIEGEGNDVIRVTFDEPMKESTVLDRSRYVLQSPLGTNLDPRAATFRWDPQTTTLTITLWRPQWLTTGAGFSVTLQDVQDVAGNPVSTTQSGIVSGDAAPPSLLWIDRNEIADPSGRTVDLYFDEPVDPAIVAQRTGFQISAGFSVVSATNLYDRRIVRVVFSGVVQPGSHTMTVQDQRDLAGNVAGTVTSVAIQP